MSITLDEFTRLDNATVAEHVAGRFGQNLGVGLPFNGTRRWYLETYAKNPEDIYTLDYTDMVLAQMRTIMGQMFADGVSAIYTPMLGQALLERGAEYMEFATDAVMRWANEAMMDWYHANGIHSSCYGRIELLPPHVLERMQAMDAQTNTPHARYHLRYGVFADRPLSHIIELAAEQSKAGFPTETEFIERYYGNPRVDMQMWIGCDQPTIFDVPLVIHESTALYFLQFPTLYLDRTLWRRLLYDLLYVRGDEETLYPENIRNERHITGLGKRENDAWMPSLL